MEQVFFERVLPNVFKSHSINLDSQFWLRDIVIERGKRYLIEAASGTGKSSLCSYIYGYRSDYEGKIVFDGVDSRDLSIDQWRELRCNRFSMLFQDLKLFDSLTAMENVEIKNRITNYKSYDEIVNLFVELNIDSKIDTPVDRLSYGQQQRVAFIRALCQPFDFIFLDEPISHLDEANGELLRTILDRECERHGASAVVTSIGKRFNMNFDKIFSL